jgi:hypothetical protein
MSIVIQMNSTEDAQVVTIGESLEGSKVHGVGAVRYPQIVSTVL